MLVKDIRHGTVGSIRPSNAYYSNLVNLSGTLFFAANNSTTGIELWKSNGTAAGTVQVKDVSPGTKGSGPFYLTSVGGTLYFTATSDTTGLELWKSDSTTTGTILVSDIIPGTSGSSLLGLTSLGGTLYFSAADTTHGRELWRVAASVSDRRVFYNH